MPPSLTTCSFNEQEDVEFILISWIIASAAVLGYKNNNIYIHILLENRLELEAEADDFEDFEISEEVIEEVTESVD